jgi:hypothetical protein
MLGAMSLPEDSDNDRRAVPRHLRDGENDLLSSTGAFGQRTEDAASRRGRAWALIIGGLTAALALGWLLLR